MDCTANIDEIFTEEERKSFEANERFYLDRKDYFWEHPYSELADTRFIIAWADKREDLLKWYDPRTDLLSATVETGPLGEFGFSKVPENLKNYNPNEIPF